MITAKVYRIPPRITAVFRVATVAYYAKAVLGDDFKEGGGERYLARAALAQRFRYSRWVVFSSGGHGTIVRRPEQKSSA